MELIWLKQPTLFSAYISSLPKIKLCPQCNKVILKSHLVKIDQDEDIYGWNFNHPCGTKLLIIND